MSKIFIPLLQKGDEKILKLKKIRRIKVPSMYKGLPINPKELPIGSVGYYVSDMSYLKDWNTNFGIVAEHYHDSIVLQLLEPVEQRIVNGVPMNGRLIDGVPIENIITPTEWRKLPKWWKYDTELFTIGYRNDSCKIKEILQNIDIRNPKDILNACESEYLVEVGTGRNVNSHSHITADIDRDLGYRLRICENSNMYHSSTRYVSLMYHKVYNNFEAAQKEVDEKRSSFKRMADMTDYEWSVHMIDYELNRWKLSFSIADIEVNKMREWLLSQDNIEDIEVRVNCMTRGLQWKYLDGKRWYNIVL